MRYPGIWTALLAGLLRASAVSADDTAGTAGGYRSFISSHKVASEVAAAVISAAEKRGVRDLPPFALKKKKVFPGTSFYYHPRSGVAVLVRTGRRPLADGINLVVAHTDAPRLTLTPRPVTSTRDLVFFNCMENGGIKNYQWLSRPLAVHGTAVIEGEERKVVIGEDDGFALIIPDMGQDAYRIYSEREGRAAVERETPALLAGSVPIESDKLSFTAEMQVRNYLYEEFGMTARELLTARLEAVPAGPAMDAGLAGSMIGGYGHDGRAGCYAALQAFMAVRQPERTAVVLFIRQEPVMLQDSAALLKRLLQDVLGMVATATGTTYDDALYRTVISGTRSVVAEVTNGVNPLFVDINELGNAAYLGKGVVLMKYLGSGGKYYTNDATAEYMGFLRGLCSRDSITWQSAEFGRVDEGGGSSLSRYVSELGLDVVDVALPVMSMHSPFALLAKTDLAEARRFYKAFLSTE